MKRLALVLVPKERGARGAAHGSDLQPGLPWELDPTRPTSIGRIAGDLCVGDGDVANTHASFTPGPDGFVVSDLRSAGGTRVNGERISAEHLLAAGDVVTLARHVDLVCRTPDERALRGAHLCGEWVLFGFDRPPGRGRWRGFARRTRALVDVVVHARGAAPSSLAPLPAHPAFPRAIGGGVHAGHPFVVLEPCPGVALASLLRALDRESRGLSARVAAFLLARVAEAVAVASRNDEALLIDDDEIVIGFDGAVRALATDRGSLTASPAASATRLGYLLARCLCARDSEARVVDDLAVTEALLAIARATGPGARSPGTASHQEIDAPAALVEAVLPHAAGAPDATGELASLVGGLFADDRRAELALQEELAVLDDEGVERGLRESEARAAAGITA